MTPEKSGYIGKIIMYVDGCSKGNPGPAAVGIVVVKGDNEEEVLKRHAKYLGGNLTNQDAEFYAVLIALSIASEICRDEVEIRSDSQYVIKEIKREFRIRKDKHKEICSEIYQKEKFFRKVTYTKVSRKHPRIKEADRLADAEVKRVLEGKK